MPKKSPSRFYLFFKKISKKTTVPNIIIAVGILSAFLYLFSWLFPFTDNSFVVRNVRPVASQVLGYITELDIKNGDFVKKGQKLFTVFQTPYILEVQNQAASLKAARAKLKALQNTFMRDENIAKQSQRVYTRLRLDFEKFKKGYALKSVSLKTLQDSQQKTEAAYLSWQAKQKQLAIDKNNISFQKEHIKAIEAKLANARVNLELTEVVADSDGIVQDLFMTLGTPINVNQPIFSLVDMSETYIQANFNETDLRFVKKGCVAYIFPRMYLGFKFFKGEVVSNFWSANRQKVDKRTQLQDVFNENQWVLLPQRLPVIIKIKDTDAKYPLPIGASAYVYVSPC